MLQGRLIMLLSLAAGLAVALIVIQAQDDEPAMGALDKPTPARAVPRDSSWSWSKSKSAPLARTEVAGAVVGRDIYVIGGFAPPSGGSSAVAAKTRKIARGRYSVPPSSTKKVKLRLTAKARRILRRRGRIRGTLHIHNTINGTTSHTKVRIRKP